MGGGALRIYIGNMVMCHFDDPLFQNPISVLLRLASTRARTRLGRVAEANYVISAFCPRQTRKSVRIIVPFVLTAGVS